MGINVVDLLRYITGSTMMLMIAAACFSGKIEQNVFKESQETTQFV
jgi:hypothetical protein